MVKVKVTMVITVVLTVVVTVVVTVKRKVWKTKIITVRLVKIEQSYYENSQYPLLPRHPLSTRLNPDLQSRFVTVNLDDWRAEVAQ